MKRIIALIYKVFLRDTKQTTPYLSTCLIVCLMLILNFVSIMLIFRIPRGVFVIRFIDVEKLNNWLNTFLFVTPLLLLFTIIFPKKIIEGYEFSDNQIRKGKRSLIIYVLISIIILVSLLVSEGVRRGFIKM